MKLLSFARPARSVLMSAVVIVCAGASTASAQIGSVTYEFQNVVLSGSAQMTGTFEWTYDVGDFESGTGEFLTMGMPWWGSDPGTLDINVEVKQIEFTLPGNWHDLGVDVIIKLAAPLTADQPSPIDLATSKYEIQKGVTHEGLFTSGSIVPICATPQNYGVGTEGSGEIVPTISSTGGLPRIGNAAFQVDCDQLVGGANCFLLAGFGKAQVPAVGVEILVDLNQVIVINLAASGTPGVAGDGELHVPLPLPNLPIAVGVEVDMQVVVMDAGSPNGFASASDGLSMTLCDGP